MSVQVERRPILTRAIGRRRPAVFGIVADGAERRRPSDLVRVALASPSSRSRLHRPSGSVGSSDGPRT